MTQTSKEFKLNVHDYDNWTSDEYAPGAVITEAGNSILYHTGGWRSNRPVWDKEKCSHCLLCWVHCPDSSVYVENQEMTGIDFDHCKGCGICAVECRFEALTMIPEPDTLSAEGGN